MGNNQTSHGSVISSRKRRKQEEKKISIQRLKDRTKITLETLKFNNIGDFNVIQAKEETDE